MIKPSQLPTSMTGLELWLGFIYLPAQVLVIPGLLLTGNTMLAHPLPAATVNFIFFCMNFLFALIIFRKFLLHTLDYTLQNLPRCLFCALRGYLIYLAGTMITGMLITSAAPDFANVNDANILALTRENYRMMAVGTVLLVPLVEETLYRGLVFGCLHQRNRILAYGVSAALFSFIHIAGYIGTYDIGLLGLCFVQYIPAGISLAWTYEHSGSVFSSILIHTTVNAMGIFAMR